MTREEKALEYFEDHHCSQAVAMAFADVCGVDVKILERASCGFGMGMNKKLTCGALTGACIALSLYYEDDDKLKPAVAYVIDEFAEHFQSTDCLSLRGEDGIHKKIPCRDLVAYATKITDRYIQNNQH